MISELTHTSVDIAKAIGVSHKSILSSCRRFSCNYQEDFVETTYTTARNKKYPCYKMSNKALFLVIKTAATKKAISFFDLFFDYIELGIKTEEAIAQCLIDIQFEINIKREFRTYILRGANTGLFKIGKTSKPVELRLKQIQGNSGEYLELICSIEKDVESILHKELRLKKTNSEWFSLDVKDFAKIKRTYIKKITIYDTIEYMLYSYHGYAKKGTKLESIDVLVNGKKTIENMNKAKAILSRDFEAHQDCDIEVDYVEVCQEIIASTTT